jgi:hypothetical protein
MKNHLSKFAILTLLLAMSTLCFAGKRLVIGAGPLVQNFGNGDWSGYSALNLIPGTSIMPITSTTTALYIAFTGGTQADISNMVLYKTTGIGRTTIASVTPVKLGGISNPSIVLTNKTICKIQPVSYTHPCIVRLDVLTLTLSPLADYWFVAYFTSDSNNVALYGATPEFQGGSLTGFYAAQELTHLTVGQSVPNNNTGHPYFLISVATN